MLNPPCSIQFGKQIQAEQVPGWSAYYLDYKALKKIISSLAANRPPAEAAALAPQRSVDPGDILSDPTTPQTPLGVVSLTSTTEEPPLYAPLGQDDDRGPSFQAHKAAFFFKLERELEKVRVHALHLVPYTSINDRHVPQILGPQINAFYLEKEAELKLRLETLLSKRRAAAMRVAPDAMDDATKNHVEWSAVEEGFRLLERDIGKLQVDGRACVSPSSLYVSPASFLSSNSSR